MKKIFCILAVLSLALFSVSCDKNNLHGAKGEATIGFEEESYEMKMAEFIHIPVVVTSKTSVWPVTVKVKVSSDMYEADTDYIVTDAEGMVYIEEPEHMNENGEYVNKAGELITPSGRLEIRIPGHRKLKSMELDLEIVDHNQQTISIPSTTVNLKK